MSNSNFNPSMGYSIAIFPHYRKLSSLTWCLASHLIYQWHHIKEAYLHVSFRVFYIFIYHLSVCLYHLSTFLSIYYLTSLWCFPSLQTQDSHQSQGISDLSRLDCGWFRYCSCFHPLLFPLLLLHVCLMDFRDYVQSAFYGSEKNKLKAMEKIQSAQHSAVIFFLHLFCFC